MSQTAKILKPYVDEKDILFVTSNINRSDSRDLDIYVVVREPARSQTIMFYGKNSRWHEIFIDTEADLAKKLNNFDEIAINFLIELDFDFGDREAFDQWFEESSQLSEDMSQYPRHRLNIIQYRIKVIYSKYCDPTIDALSKRFLLNSLNYHITNILLLKSETLPSSPKRWITQLEHMLSEQEFVRLNKLIDGSIGEEDLKQWIKEITKELYEMRLDKSIVDNSLTFIS